MKQSKHRKTNSACLALYIECEIVELLEAESRMEVAGVRGGETGRCWSRGTKYQVARISPGDLLHSNMNTVNNTVYWKFSKNSHTKQENGNCEVMNTLA